MKVHFYCVGNFKIELSSTIYVCKISGFCYHWFVDTTLIFPWQLVESYGMSSSLLGSAELQHTKWDAYVLSVVELGIN